MLDKKIGFIGCGNMGGAIIDGLIKKQIIKPQNIYTYDLNQNLCNDMRQKTGINISSSNIDLVKTVDIIVPAIKPIYAGAVFNEIAPYITDNHLILSIVTAVDIADLEEVFGKRPIVKIMPNTPAAVNEGMSMIVMNDCLSDNQKAITLEIFSAIGKTVELPERLIHGYTAACGSAPAYIFILIEAMADAAVLEGVPRKTAYEIVAQTVYGSAKMVIESGKHPAVLKDEVCSPGGLTIEGVKILEDTGFRSSIMNCMKAVIDKSKALSK